MVLPTMRIAGQLLMEVTPTECALVPGVVQIVDGVIEQVETGEVPAHFDVGGPDCVIAPGLIDAHVHLPQFDMIGAHGMPLLKWLSEVTFPAERRWEDVDFARNMTRRVLQQCLAHGTTSIAAYGTVHAASVAAALQVATELGMQGAIGHVLMDREAPAYLCRPAEQLLEQTSELIELYPSRARLSLAVTPRFAITCTPELLKGAGELASQHQTLVQTHLAETIPECDYVAQLFAGQRYIDVYRNANLCHARTIFGHGIHLSASDKAVLSTTGAVIAHCPTANSFLRSGTMDRHDHRLHGVKVALGSDIGAGYERSMVRVARAMIEAAASIGDHYPRAGEAWHMITAGNADCLGWSNVGRIRAGGSADLLVIKPTVAWANHPCDPLAMLMFAWDDRWVRRVLLRGRWMDDE